MGDNSKPEQLYAVCHDMGGMSSYAWEDDPKRLAFTLARYKHVAKMLAGKRWVLEVGCSDGFGTRIVRQAVSGGVVAIDPDGKAIEEAKLHSSVKWPVRFMRGDIFDPIHWDDPPHLLNRFEAAYALDVIEHIMPVQTDDFICSLAEHAPVVVIGTPSLESQPYASKLSREGHINCMSGEVLRTALLRRFQHVFMFSMNDETLHTGFLPMAHYLLALCVR